MRSLQRLLCALLLLQSLALTASSSVWQHSFPSDQVPHAQQQQPLPASSPPPAPRANSKYNETTALYLAHVTRSRAAHHPLELPAVRIRPVTGGRESGRGRQGQFPGPRGYSQLYDALVVAFRGSMDVTNWLDNLTFLKRRAYAQFPGVMVHQGFYWAYRSVAPQVLDTLHKLRKEHPHASLMVTGHSLGGAVAAICAFELEYIEKIPVDALYTFGKPRVGNTNFSARLRNASMEVYRVTHFQDIVPHLPQRGQV
ncbi:Alpha/Beta hydrolase fold [Phytophthora cactorum]|nr:Alpha/Beta hydrolase fold [Phytophthora cactorum]